MIIASEIDRYGGAMLPEARQASYWFPNSDSKPWGLLLMLYTWVMIVLGWVLATAVVAGITQLFRRR